jgi:Fic family protein
MKPAKPAGHANIPVVRGNESLAMMEPMVVGEANPARGRLDELAFTLNQDANRLAGQLNHVMVAGIGDLVRYMNCFYSNLIEGHNTHPIDIERAMKQDYAREPEKRDLQLEAVAHVEVQEWIDAGGADNIGGFRELAREIHRRFYELLPEALREVALPNGGKTPVNPGEWRSHDVEVGRHVPIDPKSVDRFMRRWEEAYSLPRHRLIAEVGAMHHRLAWIHPFMDGNGRVARLVAHALLKRIGVGSPLWAVSRGLARNVEQYKSLLQAADQPRRGDFDGRGALSEKALADFDAFFLEKSIDQVTFMERLIEPQALLNRILLHLRELGDENEITVMQAVYYRGELPRGDIDGLIKASPRTRARVIASLEKKKMIASENHRAPIRILFSAENAERWMPGLFPPKAA